MKAALALAMPKGMVKASADSMKENLRPSLKRRGAQSDTYEGAVREVVRKFLDGVHTVECDPPNGRRSTD